MKIKSNVSNGCYINQSIKLRNNSILRDEPKKQNVIKSDENGYKIENYVNVDQPISLFFGIDDYFDLTGEDFAKYEQYKKELNLKLIKNFSMYTIEKQTQLQFIEKSISSSMRHRRMSGLSKMNEVLSASTFWLKYFSIVNEGSLTQQE